MMPVQMFEEPPVFLMADLKELGQLGGARHRAGILKACLETLGAEVVTSGASQWARNDALTLMSHDTAVLSGGSKSHANKDVISQYFANVIDEDIAHMGSGNAQYIPQTNTLLVGMLANEKDEKKFEDLKNTLHQKVDSEMNIVSVTPTSKDWFINGKVEKKAYDIDLYLRVTDEGDIFYNPDFLPESELEKVKAVMGDDAKAIPLSGEGKVNFCQVGKCLLGSEFTEADQAKIRLAGYVPYAEKDFYHGGPLHEEMQERLHRNDVHLSADYRLGNDTEMQGETFKFYDARSVGGPHCMTQKLTKGSEPLIEKSSQQVFR